MSEKRVKAKKGSSGCGKCLLVLVVVIIGFSVLGFVFRNEIVHKIIKLRSNSSDFDRYADVSTKPNIYREVTTEDFVFLSSTDREETSTRPRIVFGDITGSSSTTPENNDDDKTVATEQMTTTTEATTTTESLTSTSHRVDNETILHEGSGSGSGKAKSTLSDDEDYVEHGST